MLDGVINYHRTTDVLWEGGGAVGVDIKWTLDISVRSIIMKQLMSWGEEEEEALVWCGFGNTVCDTLESSK